MRLNPIGQVVEGAGVRDVARHFTAGEVVNFVSERVPHATALLGAGVRGDVDGVAFNDERVEVDEFGVVVEEVEDDFARDARGQRADGCENGALRHGGLSWRTLLTGSP